MLQVRGLTVEVGGKVRVADATFRLHPGDTVGLVGRNGAGKTSMLKVIAGEAPANDSATERSRPCWSRRPMRSSRLTFPTWSPANGPER